jgi:hypothetical protein
LNFETHIPAGDEVHAAWEELHGEIRINYKTTRLRRATYACLEETKKETTCSKSPVVCGETLANHDGAPGECNEGKPVG